MNEEIQIKIIELIDKGATSESSDELKQLIESSEETKAFYKSFMASEVSLKKSLVAIKQMNLIIKYLLLFMSNLKSPPPILLI